jgi:hypothetical protein
MKNLMMPTRKALRGVEVVESEVVEHDSVRHDEGACVPQVLRRNEDLEAFPRYSPEAVRPGRYCACICNLYSFSKVDAIGRACGQALLLETSLLFCDRLHAELAFLASLRSHNVLLSLRLFARRASLRVQGLRK